MRYRSLFIIGAAIEAVFFVVPALLPNGQGHPSPNTIGFIITQLPSLLILSDLLRSAAPEPVFFGLLFVLQSAFFGAVLCVLKGAKEQFFPSKPKPLKNEFTQPAGPTHPDKLREE